MTKFSSKEAMLLCFPARRVQIRKKPFGKPNGDMFSSAGKASCLSSSDVPCRYLSKVQPPSGSDESCLWRFGKFDVSSELNKYSCFLLWQLKFFKKSYRPNKVHSQKTATLSSPPIRRVVHPEGNKKEPSKKDHSFAFLDPMKSI